MEPKIVTVLREKGESEVAPVRGRLGLKLVRVYKGKMLSLFYDGTGPIPFEDRHLLPIAEYAVSQVTDSPTKEGLFCYPWKSEKGFLKGILIQVGILRRDRDRYHLALLSVRMYGMLPDIFPGLLNCRSVYVKKIIWSDQ